MEGDRSAASPLVVFTSRPNSHTFQERHIYCQDPVKIGRSVARAHPVPTNAIFDCKVLSRNHALLWFEDNKFYLQDTKSSNGTFVNNQRLSKGAEESDPHEIFSGDIIQFGVDVMENSKRVTHGCIMASITLYLPDGTEAKPRFSSGSQSSSHSISAVHSQEMYQLSQYLQEALHREQILQDKMTHLQSLLHTTNDSCETSWHALISEDRLLSKLEVLQNQLSAFSKTQTEASLQQQIVTMEEERQEYENSSKESLRKVLEEKIAAIQELSDVERSLANAENECKHLNEVHDENQRQFSELTEKYEKKVAEHSDLSHQLQEAEQRREEELVQFEEARSVLQAKIEETLADKDTLQAKITHLQSQQNLLISKPDESRKSNGDGDDARLNGDMLDESECDPESSVLSSKEHIESLTAELNECQLRIEGLQNKLNEADIKMREKDDEIESLKQNMEQAQLEIVSYVTKVATLEERLNSSTQPIVSHAEQTVEQLHEQIASITTAHEGTVQKLKGELESAKSVHGPAASGDALSEINELQGKLELAQSNTNELNARIQTVQEELCSERLLLKERGLDVHRLQDELEQTKQEVETQTLATAEFKEKAKMLEEKLQEVSALHKQQVEKSEEDCCHLREEASNNKNECETMKAECTSLRLRIQSIEEDLLRLQDDNTKLDGEVVSTKSLNEELAGEISQLQKSYEELKELKDLLETNESAIKANLTDCQKEAEILKLGVEDEKAAREELLKKYEQSVDELKLTKEQVEITQARHSEAKERLETVNKQLAAANEEFKILSEKSKAGGMLCSTLPIVVLMLAVALALYPFLTQSTSNS